MVEAKQQRNLLENIYLFIVESKHSTSEITTKLERKSMNLLTKNPLKITNKKIRDLEEIHS